MAASNRSATPSKSSSNRSAYTSNVMDALAPTTYAIRRRAWPSVPEPM
jgi:hypothetical protein